MARMSRSLPDWLNFSRADDDCMDADTRSDAAFQCDKCKTVFGNAPESAEGKECPWCKKGTLKPKGGRSDSKADADTKANELAYLERQLKTATGDKKKELEAEVEKIKARKDEFPVELRGKPVQEVADAGDVIKDLPGYDKLSSSDKNFLVDILAEANGGGPGDLGYYYLSALKKAASQVKSKLSSAGQSKVSELIRTLERG